VQSNGRFDFIEFALNYHTSSTNFNHSGHPDFSYTAVVDYNNINLTPLGKFVMPPPMFQKQVTLTQGHASCLYLYGHTICTLSNNTLTIFDCEAMKAP
jgi:hypothetical protein